MCQRDQCFSMNQDGEHERDNTDIEHASTHEPATPAPATEPYSRQPNPLSEAPFLSRLTFRWPYALLKLGMQRPLEEHDLQENLPQDESTVNRMYLERLWGQECQKHPSHPSLHRALFRDFLTSIWYIQPMMAATATAKVIQAVALGLLIESFEESSNSSDGYLWAGVLVLCGVVMLLEHHHVFFFTWHKGMQYRIACVAAIYEKSLHLSSTSSDSHHHVPKSGAAKRSKTKTNATSSGKVINLATNDVERFIMASLFISYLWWAPIQSLAILGVGIWLLGPAFAAGFALLVIIFVPMQAWLSKQFAGYRSKIAAITDQRVTLVSQAVYGARVMKMSGWEWQFLKRIQQLRRAEVEQIAKANRLKAWNEALFFSANVVISVVIFLVHVGTGGELSPRSVFTVMTLINVVQLEMTKHVSLGVMGVSECYVSISRIQKFLEYPELPVTAASQAARVVKPNDPHHGTDSDPVLLSVLNMTCYWNSVDQHRQQKHGPTSLFLALSDISLEFRKGQLTCIIGTVGCGKSALLQALVGELPVSSGSLTRTYQTLSYAAQDPWIMDGTVRENIVMGMEWNEEWYEQVVEACGLTIDFAQFRKGDATIVGDRGVQCSGGQRARIGLARALYRDADVLICDDPLSAVDAKVGRLIYFEAIEGLAVSRGRCVVLATHQHQYLSDARCVLMLAGRVACVGSYDECLETSGGRLTAHAPDSTVDDVAPANEDVDKESMDMRVLDDAEHPLGKAEAIGDPDDDGKEANVTGVVQLSTFLSYARAMGGVWVGVSLLLLFAITQASVLVTIAVLGRWAERPTEDQGTWDIMGLVLGLACAVLFLSVLRAMLSFNLTVQASRRLHDGMAKAVLRAKIEFFDTNPLGRILNRFSADVGSNDDLLPHTLFDFLMIFFMVIGAVVTSMVVLPYTLVALVPLLWYFLSVRRIFVTTTRELKRLEGLARSPIFAMLGESLSGIATIRSNDALDYFRHKFEEAHDAHSRAFFAFMASSRWVGFRMDSLVFALLAVASFMSVLFQQQGWFSVDSAIMGLALSTLLQLAGIFQWCIRQSAEVVNQMVSVERVLGFENVPSEAPLEMDSDKAHVDKGWPREGTIEVEQLSVRYRASLPLSLERVSFRIPSGARVGVVGRTGSGKSTLVQSLFRLLEAEHGSVQLSGVDISTLGLHTVRTNMSVIPQVPVLFSGCSVRDNLDPFHKHTDSTIREALEDVHMAAVISELPHGWDSFVAEGGTNFSVGQRQLLCLARAILSKHRVLVLDEPTANVDRKTDQLLQEALQKSFAGATILSVAHRLDTVIDNDQILVLGNGHVLEYGRPGELLETSNGHFASMVRDTGETMSRSLRRRASELQVENEVKRKSDLTGSSRGLLDS